MYGGSEATHGLCAQSEAILSPNMILEPGVKEVFATSGDCEHFFGYYDKSPFDAAGRRLLSHRVGFESVRMPTKDDQAGIVVWDIEGRTSREVARTHAFNWQQGAMLQWLGPDFDSRILFNDFRDGRYVSVVLDVSSGETRILPLPVYSVSLDGCWAVCVNFERHFWCRPGYNYACGGDPKLNVPVPDEDGISLMDLCTGEHRLVIRTRQMVDLHHVSSMDSGDNYLEHLLLAPDGERFFFLHRWRTADGDGYTRAYAASRDGTDIRLVSDSGDVSHYAWQDEHNVMVYGSEKAGINALRRSRVAVKYLLRPFRPLFKMIVRPDSPLEKMVLPYRFQLVDVVSGEKTIVGSGQLQSDGHPAFKPGNPDVFVCDTYREADGCRRLYLFDVKRNARRDLARLATPDQFNETAWRCDLHPRWDRQGKRICVDAAHTGSRQMHVFGVGKVS